MNPKLALAVKIYSVLSEAVENEAAQKVPVYTHVPLEHKGGEYIFLSQYTAAELPESGCRGESGMAWRCTLLADAITPFKTQGQASDIPGMLLTEQAQTLIRTLAGQVLESGYIVDTVRVELTNSFGETEGDAYWLHNTTRFAFLIRQQIETYYTRALRVTTSGAYRMTATGALRAVQSPI